METYVITALSSTILIALGIIGYLYNSIQQRNEKELNYISHQYEQLNDNMLSGFKEIRNVLSEFHNRIALEESKQLTFQEQCGRISAIQEKTFERFDKRIENIEKMVANHDLEIGLLKKSYNARKKNINPGG